jgi:hypothetical protein
MTGAGSRGGPIRRVEMRISESYRRAGRDHGETFGADIVRQVAAYEPVFDLLGMGSETVAQRAQEADCRGSPANRANAATEPTEPMIYRQICQFCRFCHRPTNAGVGRASLHPWFRRPKQRKRPKPGIGRDRRLHRRGTQGSRPRRRAADRTRRC